MAAILCMAAGLQPLHALAAGWDIEQLMQTLAAVRSARATFTEKKFISLLDKPVESSGELVYVAPSRFVKRTLQPKPETMVLEGNTLTLERDGRKRTLQLQEQPEVAALVDSVRGTLAGDRKTLERSFSLALEGSAGQWTLLLTPRSASAQRFVREIRIAGAGDALRSVETQQTDGDSSLMTITRTARP
jgi:outer membrane lipoprotein-sorting protein